MKKNLTELVFILDKSGSMSGMEADTIGGFNSMIEKQRKEEGDALVSTVLFFNESHVIHDRVSIGKIEPLTERQYFVGGGTALIDAIGQAIHHIETYTSTHGMRTVRNIPSLSLRLTAWRTPATGTAVKR